MVRRDVRCFSITPNAALYDGNPNKKLQTPFRDLNSEGHGRVRQGLEWRTLLHIWSLLFLILIIKHRNLNIPMCELLLKCKLKKRKPVFIVLETKICVTSKQKAKGGGREENYP